MPKSNITNTADFKANANFCFRINGYSIWWKHRNALKDASRFVLIADGRQVHTPSEDMLYAVADACNMKNPTTGKRIEKLTAVQKKNLQIALNEHDKGVKVADLKKYGIGV
jgi:hypothetical protein